MKNLLDKLAIGIFYSPIVAITAVIAWIIYYAWPASWITIPIGLGSAAWAWSLRRLVKRSM